MWKDDDFAKARARVVPRPVPRVFLDRLHECVELLRINTLSAENHNNYADTDRAGAHYPRAHTQFSTTRARRPLNFPPRSITKQSLLAKA